MQRGENMTAQEHDAKELIRFAMDTVQSAGDQALEYYGKGNPKVKFDEELVTEAELKLSNFFRSRLRAQFPDHRIFGEETMAAGYTHDAGGYVWVFDAFDGVANFQAGIPVWGTSMALLENFWPILGIFFMPVTKDLFYAQAGGLAYHGDRKVAIPDQPEVNNESLLFTYSRFNTHYRTSFPGKIRNLGCTAAHICYVACGRAEAALMGHVSYQDLAAAQIILEAAGGEIRKVDGNKFHLNEYLDGRRIEDHLMAARKGKHSAVRDYLKESL
jgi:myo-inositol-1(or 4)-monophosphatase